MSPLGWTVVAYIAAAAAAAAGLLLRPRLARRRAQREQAARAYLATLQAQARALRPDAEFWQLLAEHPELTKDDG